MTRCKFYIKSNCSFRKNGLCLKYKSSKDDLRLRCSGRWSKNKINYLKYYAGMFSTGMKNKWPRLYYIDLFSGPGKCIIREGLQEVNGTCLEVVSLRDKFTKYFFIDKNPICIRHLKKRMKGLKNIEYYTDDCNKAIESIVTKIPDYSLSMAIIDPDSLQFCFSSYENLSRKKIDLIVNYPIGPIERAISSVRRKKLNSKKLDKFHPGWRDIVEKNTWGNSKRIIIRKLIKDYVEKVEALDYYSSPSIVPFKNIKNTTMYYLILFSKDKKGIEFWNKVTNSLKKKNPQQSFL